MVCHPALASLGMFSDQQAWGHQPLSWLPLLLLSRASLQGLWLIPPTSQPVLELPVMKSKAIFDLPSLSLPLASYLLYHRYAASLRKGPLPWAKQLFSCGISE